MLYYLIEIKYWKIWKWLWVAHHMTCREGSVPSEWLSERIVLCSLKMNLHHSFISPMEEEVMGIFTNNCWPRPYLHFSRILGLSTLLIFVEEKWKTPRYQSSYYTICLLVYLQRTDSWTDWLAESLPLTSSAVKACSHNLCSSHHNLHLHCLNSFT